MKATPVSSNRLVLICTLLAAVLLITLPALAQREDDADRKSKNGKTEGVIAGVEVVLEYGKPLVKERQIWGGLVPYGKIWRTGANEATTISFSKDVTIEGKPLAAGTYALFTIPGEEKWVIIFNKTAKQWGAYDYDEKEDALRVEVVPTTGEHVEAMNFILDDSKVELQWEKLRVAFKVEAAS